MNERAEWRGARRIAEVLAAKEAVLKALGAAADEVDWQQIEVSRRQGAVRISVSLTGQRIRKWHVSTAATRTLAVAWVVVERSD